MANVLTEQVLVVPTAEFHRRGHFQGFSSEAERYLAELLAPAHTSFRPRSEMEEDPSFKQLIPYCIFRHLDRTGRDLVFQYVRGKGQGEQRLHSRRSIGIGGHISSTDGPAAGKHDLYREGLARELAEELIIDTPYTEHCVGLINDDLSPVGQVHLGVVHLFDVEDPAIRPREDDILEAGFLPVAELLARIDEFETWSQICLKALFAGDDKAEPVVDN